MDFQFWNNIFNGLLTSGSTFLMDFLLWKQKISIDFQYRKLSKSLKESLIIHSFIRWREAPSSTGRLVTGSVQGMAQKTKWSITRSIFELEARNFAWYLLLTSDSFKDFDNFLYWKSIENFYFHNRKSIKNVLPLVRSPLKMLFQNWKPIEI